MRVLVTGSRTWTDEDTIRQALFEAQRADVLGEMIVVHGDCPRGADAIADRIARVMGWTIERYPANWDRYGKRAGFIRNLTMATDGADVCLAFIRDGSHGATDCATKARLAGIPVREYLA